MKKRHARVKRVTRETSIVVKLNIDGTGNSFAKTGIPFFDHMLALFAKHAVVDLYLHCEGDLDVDAHHTVEDCGIALGQAFLRALGDKKGIRRYGTGFDPGNPFTGEAYIPMDECLARCVVDFSGRPFLVWRGNLHLELLYGGEPHHVAEALFKAFAKAVDFACQRDPRIGGLVPSTKGKL